MNGNYLINISPIADGTIPPAAAGTASCHGRVARRQRRGHLRHPPVDSLRRRPRRSHSPEPEWRAPGPDDPPNEAYSGREIRFTTNGDTLYAIVMDWPGAQAVVTALGGGRKIPARRQNRESRAAAIPARSNSHRTRRD